MNGNCMLFLLFFAAATSDIKAITEETAAEEFNRSGKVPLFVKFWSPWCKHCLALRPVFAGLAESPKFLKRVEFARFDCNMYDKYCKRHHFGTPSFWYVKTDLDTAVPCLLHSFDYETLYFFLEKQMYDYLGTIESSEEFANVTREADRGVTFIFSIVEGDENALDIALNVSSALKYTDLRFFRNTSTTTSSLVAYRSHYFYEKFEAEWTLANVYDFIKDNMHSLIARFDALLVRELRSSNRLCALIVAERDDQIAEYFNTEMKLYSEVQYAYVINRESPKVLDHTGLLNRKAPFAVVLNITQDVWWTQPDPLTLDNLYSLIDVAISDASLAHAIGRGAPNNTVIDRFKFWCYDTVGSSVFFYSGIGLVTALVLIIIALPILLTPEDRQKTD